MLKLFIVLLSLLAITLSAQNKRVLAEVFTNSHCPTCPGAHNAIKDFTTSSPNGNRIIQVYYHMSFPYNDDRLYLDNITQPGERFSYYNLIASTPRVVLNGSPQNNNYSQYPGIFNNLLQETEKFSVSLSGTKKSDSLTIESVITAFAGAQTSNVKFFILAVENVYYPGRNGITLHKNVLRSMVNGSSGEDLVIAPGDTRMISKKFKLQPSWIADSLSFIVFIQNSNSKEIFQSAELKYQSLLVSSVQTENSPLNFSVTQNYPNPFNPETTIYYTISETTPVTFTVYNAIGKLLYEQVVSHGNSGTYQIKFSGKSYPSGTYFYRVQTDKSSVVKKMILLK